jgi:hypothetical protein
MLVQVRFGLRLLSTAMLVPAAGLAQSTVPANSPASTPSTSAEAPASAPSTSAEAPAPVASATASEGRAFPPCDHGPSSSDLSAAKGAFQAGWVSFDEGDYARAITYWEDAFRRDCTALALLLNLARAYELAGKLDQAVGALQTYLERMPESPERDSIQRRIEVLKEKIAETRPSEPAPVESLRPEPVRDRQAHEPKPRLPPPPPEPPAEHSIVPIVLSGVGLVALVGGGAIYLDARHAVSDYTKQCDVDGSRTCPDDQTRDAANKARTRVQIGSVVALAGAAATVGGLIWYFVSPPRPMRGGTDGRGRVALEPNVAPGFAGVVVLGAY